MTRPLKILGIHHYTVSVSNIDASVKWHAEKQGYMLLPEKSRRRGLSRIAYMQAPGFLLEILEVPGAGPVPPYAISPDTDLSVRGHKHYALLLDDAKQAARDLRTLGATVVDEKEVGALRAAFIADDSGALIELLQQGPSSYTDESKQNGREGQPILIKGIHHVAINVPSRDQTMAWYVEKLGLTPASTMEIPGTDVKIGFLDGPGFSIEVFEVCSAAPIPDWRMDPAQDMETLGNKYFGLAVPDLDQAVADLKSLGVEIIDEKGSGERSLFIRDNAGIIIELNEKEIL